MVWFAYILIIFVSYGLSLYTYEPAAGAKAGDNLVGVLSSTVLGAVLPLVVVFIGDRIARQHGYRAWPAFAGAALLAVGINAQSLLRRQYIPAAEDDHVWTLPPVNIGDASLLGAPELRESKTPKLQQKYVQGSVLYEHSFCPYKVIFIKSPKTDVSQAAQSVVAFAVENEDAVTEVNCALYPPATLDEMTTRATNATTLGGQYKADIKKFENYIIGNAVFERGGLRKEIISYFGPSEYQIMVTTVPLDSSRGRAISEQFLKQAEVFGKPFNSQPFLKEREVLHERAKATR